MSCLLLQLERYLRYTHKRSLASIKLLISVTASKNPYSIVSLPMAHISYYRFITRGRVRVAFKEELYANSRGHRKFILAKHVNKERACHLRQVLAEATILRSLNSSIPFGRRIIEDETFSLGTGLYWSSSVETPSKLPIAGKISHSPQIKTGWRNNKQSLKV